MNDEPADKKPAKGFRALTNWLKRPGRPHPGAGLATASAPEKLPARVGRYAITGKLGQGGMGIVYAARDERLERSVALKTMSSLSGDKAARQRFWREAKAAARVNHPNVCQLYEIGEDRGELFLVMELLEGESLAQRLRRGAMNVTDTLPIGLGILRALSALHSGGIIHRDLKPSNVFLTPHGIKLLDFGLARTVDLGASAPLGSLDGLTRSGEVMGTPYFMAPEQIVGEPTDGRTDIFATGAILFEMLAGRPAFRGRNVVEILHATLHENPPALTGSPAVAAVDRVIRRALAKRPSERPESAEAMAEELRGVGGDFGDDTPVLARTLTRIVVLPFRVLRPDPETDFLSFSLPDAIATSLARFGSLVVRSSAAAARFGEAPDLKVLAAEADVDRVVTGTLLRSGDQVQATAQLVEAPGGTLVTSHTILSSLGDLFRLQDDMTRRLVEALAMPLAGGGVTSAPDSPAEATPNARGYELYLRANELARDYENLSEARDLYRQCVEIDPGFAPAWAQLGRCHRVIGKYLEDAPDSFERSEAALRRALEINPRLSLAHKYYANLEADTGQTRNAMVRLLGVANRHGTDPELFAGLVHACRYCGLFEQSIAAHHEARRLDPNVATSAAQTVMMTGDLEQLMAHEALGAGDEGILVIGLGLAGRRDEARRVLLEMRQAIRVPLFQPWADFLLAWLERRPADMLDSRAAFLQLKIMDDPEAIFQEGWLYCDIGEHERGLDLLRRAVDLGYCVAPTLIGSRSFDATRNDPRFRELLARAEAARDRALTAFREGGGERLLGR